MNQPLQKSRLGRGLASLIGEPMAANPVKPAPEGEQRMVAIDQVRAGNLNPRKEFRDEELAELTASIRAKGLVQPILVRPAPAGPGYEIVAGERRWRAAQKAGLPHIPVIVRELADREVLELAIIENVQRADLNAIEEAGGYRDLIERFGYNQEQLSDMIGKSRSHVANTLRLLKLPAPIQQHLAAGRLSAGHARALIGRSDAEAIADRIIALGLNVRDVEAMVQEGATASSGPAFDASTFRRNREKDPDTKAFEKELSDLLGLKIEIKRSSGESGTLIIKYGNFDQLEYIRLRLMGQTHG